MVVNMTERIIDKEIKLFPYYRNDEVPFHGIRI